MVKFSSSLTETFACSLGSHRQLLLNVVGLATCGLPVRAQSTGADVFLITTLTYVRPIIGVKALMKLQVYKLRELLRTEITGVGFLAAVQPKMRLEVGR